MLHSFLAFLRLIYAQRRLILAMARREIKSQYIGSFLGILWAFIHPVVLICVFWFVFGVGFKAKPMNDAPFVVWLTAGMAPWFLITEIINSSAVVVIFHGQLVKKTIFFPQILPVIKVLSSLVTHTVFLAMLLLLIVFHSMPFSFWFLQFFYYLVCLVVLALGCAWAVSALNVFMRDVAMITSILLQIGFWVTPIFWDITMMSPQVQRLLKFNPMYYVVQGYRESFIDFVPFWHHAWYTLYFWSVAGLTFMVGALIFKRLKPQFSDVL
ncbi:MAG: teichoic acid ABC transporter permease [Desulfobulbaceae bacterium A2]|nr:MAG: teichoic acid ABC transporter permease [Desulfobulbaceae bacterium A2]